MVDINTTVVSRPVPLASTSSPSYTTLLPAGKRRNESDDRVCEPCRQKTNCGECTYGNRKNSHQICEKRKCEELKKEAIQIIVSFGGKQTPKGLGTPVKLGTVICGDYFLK